MALYLPYIVGSSSVLYLSNKIYGVIYDNNNDVNNIIPDKYFEIENIDLEKKKITEEKVEKPTEEKLEKTTEEKVKKKKCKLCRNTMPNHCFSKKQFRKKTSICKVCWKLN